MESLRQRGEFVEFLVTDGVNVDGIADHDKTNLFQINKLGRLMLLPFFPCLLLQMIFTGGYAGRSFKQALDRYWHAYGLHFVISRKLFSCKPRGVLVSSDHSLLPCAFVIAANGHHVPTFYLQHACVTEKFPPLMTTYALLDGHDALQKYASVGPTETTAYLVGITRYDEVAGKENRSNQTRRVGICTSIADDVSRTQQLIKDVATSDVDLQITLRPHPRTDKEVLRQYNELVEQYDLMLSSTDETAFEFLTRQDAIIAGASSIALEAALLQVLPLHYVLNDTDSDWYGFIEKGLCKSFDDTASLVEYLRHAKPLEAIDRELTRFYCETVGTPWHGKSTELASSVITTIAAGQQPSSKYWRQVDLACVAGSPIQAFGLQERESGFRATKGKS